MKRLMTVLAMVTLAGLGVVQAQPGRIFKTRLSPVPVAAYNANIIGSGSVTATLHGNTLSVSGTYEGLASPATQAKIFKSPKPGIRGEAILDLTVSGGTSGTIAGELTLTAAQVQEVSASRYYVQVFSEKAAEGNLWGWLMPQQEKGK
jgi:hypothetical protein